MGKLGKAQRLSQDSSQDSPPANQDRASKYHRRPAMAIAIATATATHTLLGPGVHLTSHFLHGSSRKLHIAAPAAASPLRNSKNFRISSSPVAMDSLLNMLGFGRGAAASSSAPPHPIAQGPDDDVPAAGGNALACFGAGCFWGVELAFQRVPGVTKTEVGYTQGNTHMPTYEDVCGGRTGVFGCQLGSVQEFPPLMVLVFGFSSGGIIHFGFQSHFERGARNFGPSFRQDDF